MHATVPSSVSFVSDKSQTGFGGAGVWFGEACGSYMEGDWSLAIDDRIDGMDRWVAVKNKLHCHSPPLTINHTLNHC